MILIIEPVLSGHHFNYLNWSLSALLEKYTNVVIATSLESSQDNRLLALQEKYKNNMIVMYFDFNRDLLVGGGFFKNVIMQVKILKLFRSWVAIINKTVNVEAVFLPYLDYVFYALSLWNKPFGDIVWSGIVMRPNFYLNDANGECTRGGLNFKEYLFVRVLSFKNLKSIFVIDPLLFEFINSKYRNAHKVKYLADPVEMAERKDKYQARHEIGISQDSYVILVYGVLDSRKGVDVLMEALSDSRMPNDIVVVLAGKQDSFVTQLLCQENLLKLKNSDRLIELNKYVDEETELLVFSACDVVWLGYKNHYGMSGVLVQAGQMGLPVIACDIGLIKWFVETYHMGVISAVDAEAVVSAICELYINRIQLSEDVVRFFKQSHSISRFKEEVINGVFCG